MRFPHTKESYGHLLLKEDNQKVLDKLIQINAEFQLVYMDPPYNTGRLRGARKHFRDTEKQNWQKDIFTLTKKVYTLLKDTGFLAVSINQMELFNLKPILDNVFGADCFVGLFPVKIRHKDRQLMINATFHDLFEYLLIYRKKKTTRFFTQNKTAREDKFIYTIETSDSPPKENTINGKRVEIYEPQQYQILKTGYSPAALRRYILAGKLATGNWSGEWYEKHLRQLGNNLLVRVWGLDNAGLGFRWFQTGNANRRSGVYFQSTLSAGRPILPCNDLDFTEVVPTIYREGGIGCDFKDSKKPEALLRFLIEICTQQGDLILDPFGGSGTTLAVAEKTGRNTVVIENNPIAGEVIERRIDNLKQGLDLDGMRYDFSVGNAVNHLQYLNKNTLAAIPTNTATRQMPPKITADYTAATRTKHSLLFSK
ncbi:MAG: site-specific DNA-methyltransferase [Planctomycetaceae bacterium]|jgi:adenine-specific DNA-methyltransferase|nr:site-specific DNA-methyltransferase [Planctomycetaceae bacterium]